MIDHGWCIQTSSGKSVCAVSKPHKTSAKIAIQAVDQCVVCRVVCKKVVGECQYTSTTSQVVCCLNTSNRVQSAGLNRPCFFALLVLLELA